MAKFIIVSLLLAVCNVAFAQRGWVVQPSGTTYNLVAMDFISPEHGVAVGATRTIMRTWDGGATWARANIGAGGQQLTSVHFLNDEYVVAAGGTGEVFASTDGGTAWSQRLQYTHNYQFLAISQLGASEGIVAGYLDLCSVLMYTTNGWQSTQTHFFCLIREGAYVNAAIRAIHFFDFNSGVATMSLLDGTGAVVKTTDRGENWTTQRWLEHAAYAVDFPTDSIGYVCGAGGMVARTTDGGESWTEFSGHWGGTYWAIKFVNPDTGWVVGDSGTIERWRISDDSFVAQPSGVRTTLRGVDFLDEWTGYAVGDSGVILKTITAGDTTNHAPCAFARIAPQDSCSLWYPQAGPVTFSWTRARDVEGDSVRYHLNVQVWQGTFWASQTFTTADTVFSDSLRTLWATPTMPVQWRVWATDGNDSTEASNGQGRFTIQSPDAVDAPFQNRHSSFGLVACPNPFNPDATLVFSLSQPGEVSLVIFDLSGRRVFDQTQGLLVAGEHRIRFDGSRYPSGVYVARLETPHTRLTTKMILIK